MEDDPHRGAAGARGKLVVGDLLFQHFPFVRDLLPQIKMPLVPTLASF